MLYNDLSIFNRSFWDLWIQKLLRNIASVKYQWLAFLYVPVVWGMFHTNPADKTPWISSALGLGFLGGGFITLATSRMIVRTKLREDADDTSKPYPRTEAVTEPNISKSDVRKAAVIKKKIEKAIDESEISSAKARAAKKKLELYKATLNTSGIHDNSLDTDI